jgi:Pvc16 N-terminal domain/CarboxypepD_reg-like domain
MFQDLDATLQAVLGDAAAPADLRNADVSFDTPDRNYQPTQASLNLFLHEVSENRALRDDARMIQRNGTTYTSTMPALRVDCNYLVTAWSPDTAGLKAQQEHLLLGLALLWLSRFPVIDETYLQGMLANPVQPYPVSTVLAQVKEGRGFGDFWTALGVPPRPAFSLTVTIALQPFDVPDTFPAVETVQIRSASLDWPALTGRVLDHNLNPVPAATVTVAETGTQVVTDAAGQFTVTGLAFSTYTLRVSVTGQPDQQQTIVYAADNQVHDVFLTSP